MSVETNSKHLMTNGNVRITSTCNNIRLSLTLQEPDEELRVLDGENCCEFDYSLLVAEEVS